MNSDQVLNLASISAKLKDFVKEIFEISNSNTYNVKGTERFNDVFPFSNPLFILYVILVCIKWDLSNNLCSSFCIFMRCIVSFTDSATIHLHKKTLLAPMGSRQWIRTTHTGSLIFHKYLKIHSSTIIGHSHVHHKQCSLNSIFFISV